MSATIQERVAAGAAWLDAHEPDYYAPDPWYERIEVEHLQLTSTCNCVLGQLWGNYWTAVREQALGDTAPLGFNVRAHLLVADRIAEVAALEAEWYRVITARRAARAEQ